MTTDKIKKAKRLLNEIIKGNDEKSEKLRTFVLQKLDIKEEDFESPALAEMIRTEVKERKDKKINWAEIEQKPDLEKIKYDDQRIIKAVKKTRERIKEVESNIPKQHDELKGIGSDNHHKEKHKLESHTESDLLKNLYRLVSGEEVDDLHKHKGKEEPKRNFGIWNPTHFHDDVYYKKDEINASFANYYTKTQVDALIAVENLWDRITATSTLTPHTANDNMDIGSGNFTTTGDINAQDAILSADMDSLSIHTDTIGPHTFAGDITFDTNIDLGVNNLTTTGSIYNKADNSKHYFGASDDASIYFDAADLIINSENVTALDEVHFTNWTAVDFNLANLTSIGEINAVLVTSGQFVGTIRTALITDESGLNTFFTWDGSEIDVGQDLNLGAKWLYASNGRFDTSVITNYIYSHTDLELLFSWDSGNSEIDVGQDLNLGSNDLTTTGIIVGSDFVGNIRTTLITNTDGMNTLFSWDSGNSEIDVSQDLNIGTQNIKSIGDITFENGEYITNSTDGEIRMYGSGNYYLKIELDNSYFVRMGCYAVSNDAAQLIDMNTGIGVADNSHLQVGNAGDSSLYVHSGSLTDNLKLGIRSDGDPSIASLVQLVHRYAAADDYQVQPEVHPKFYFRSRERASTTVNEWGSLQRTNAHFLIESPDEIINLASDVYIGDPTSLGAEKLTNGNFTGSATGWTLGTGWAYGTNNVTKNSDGTGTLSQATGDMVSVFEVGKLYKISFDVSAWTVGDFTITAGGQTIGYWRHVAGTNAETYEYYFIAESNTALTITPTNTSRFTLDNISIKEIAEGNLRSAGDLNITCPANKTLELQTAVYKDINMAGYLLTLPAASFPGVDTFRSTGGVDTTIETYAFAVGELVHGGFELQHDYKEGTDLTFHIHWQGIAAPTGTDNVQWRLTYIVARDGVTLAAATTIDSPDTAIDTQYRCYRTDFAAITGTNFKIGDQFMFTLTRVAATGDAYAGDALIETAGIHYQVNTIGSRAIITK